MVDQASEDTDDRWTLRASDRALLGNKIGTTRLGFAVLLKVFQTEGRFPRRPEEVPVAAVEAIARQIGAPAAACVATIGAAEPSHITGHRSATPSDFARPHRTMPRPSRAGWKARSPRWSIGRTGCW
jgi:hypothetical protein